MSITTVNIIIIICITGGNMDNTKKIIKNTNNHNNISPKTILFISFYENSVRTLSNSLER
jgi:intracellular sulfur oxidation DsrE/DsrF family protein